jgi:hypothetical protein
MRAAVLLDLDDVTFLEPSFERLADDNYTQMLVSTKASRARLLISEDEWPLALALSDGTSWKVGSFLLRRPNEAIIEKAEELDADILQEDRREWEKAVREYYSLRIAREVPPALEDFNPKRAASLAELLKERWGTMQKETCLDAGCGSGAGAVALRAAGLEPLSYDNDPSLISLGLRTGRLLPEDTVCLDGTRASHYLPHCRLGAVIMAGEISPHNTLIWKRMINEVLELSDNTLATFGAEKEARLVEAWGYDKHRRVEVFENRRELFYDSWVCDIRRS